MWDKRRGHETIRNCRFVMKRNEGVGEQSSPSEHLSQSATQHIRRHTHCHDIGEWAMERMRSLKDSTPCERTGAQCWPLSGGSVLYLQVWL